MARPAPAATRATDIVAFLTAHPSRGFTISELVRHLEMNIASAHATLSVLEECGFVIRHPIHRTYVLGPALAATGFAALEQHPAVGAAIEQAELLADELDAELSVSALAGRDTVFLARVGPQPLETSVGYPGDRAPLLAPMGAIFMAWSDDTTVEDWLTRGGVAAEVAGLYRRVLEEIRTLGFSVPMRPIRAPAVADAIGRLRMDPTEKAEDDLAAALHETDEMLLLVGELSPTDEVSFTTVAAPIFDPVGTVLLSLSVTGPNHPVSVERVFALGRRLVQSAALVTRQTRGKVPERDINTRAANT